MDSDPDPAADILVQLFILVLLILLNAFFAASEIAIVSLNSNKVKRMSENGNKKAKKISRLTSNPSRFFATIQLGVTLSGFLASASAAQSFADGLSKFFSSFISAPPGFINTISVLMITFILSYFTLVFGELVPKRIAVQKSESLALGFASLLSAINFVMKPFIALLASSANAVIRMIGINLDESKEKVTEEEIRLMVDVGEEAGSIEENQKDMINNIFEFDDRTVGEIMTHRTEVTAIEKNMSIKYAANTAIEMGYSRIPVYEEDIDNILGIVYAKDLLKYVGQDIDGNILVSEIMRPPLFVPESKKCRDLFTEMTAKKLQMAIVLDEYGGTAGVITMEDLLESIVGNIQDEYDDEEIEIEQVDDATFTIDGTTDIIEVERLLGVELPEGDYDTIGGMMIYLLGFIPGAAEHPSITIDDITFTVEESDERRVLSVLVVKNVSEETEET